MRDVELDTTDGIDDRCEPSEVDLEVVVDGDAGLVDDGLGEQLGAAKGVGGVYRLVPSPGMSTLRSLGRLSSCRARR